MAKAQPATGGRSGAAADFASSLDFEAIAAYAGLAPSIHNTQPWKISIVGRDIEIRVDPSRVLAWLDPDSRLARISCGAAAEFTRLAVRSTDHECHVALDGAGNDLVARLTVGGKQPISAIEDEMVGSMAIRYTDRGPYEDRQVSPALLREVTELTAGHGTWLTEVRDHGQRRAVILSLSNAEAVEVADPAYRAELDAWLRSKPHADGIPGAALMSWPAGHVGDVPLRDFAGDGSAGADLTGEEPPTVERDLLVVILTAADEPADWAAAGRTLAILTLRAAAMGVTSQPLGPATDFAAARHDLRQAMELVGWPQFLLRLGYGHGRPTTGRREKSTA
jgi:hypothetical protein